MSNNINKTAALAANMVMHRLGDNVFGGDDNGPIVINLDQFKDENYNGFPLGTLIMIMTSQSLLANGALQTRTSSFADSSLFDALNTDRQVIFSADLDNAIIKFSTLASCLHDGRVWLYSFGGPSIVDNMVIDVKVVMYFLSSTEIELSVSSTQLK